MATEYTAGRRLKVSSRKLSDGSEVFDVQIKPFGYNRFIVLAEADSEESAYESLDALSEALKASGDSAWI